jgi:hypothetical protein
MGAAAAAAAAAAQWPEQLAREGGSHSNTHRAPSA